MTRKVWCVTGRDGLWCATFRGYRPSPDATQDRTACGTFIVMRYGSAKRTPTCPDCRARVERRRKPQH